MSGVQSFERELGILFERWLAEVERRLGTQSIAMPPSRHGSKATALPNTPNVLRCLAR
jgi:hypothetical protein